MKPLKVSEIRDKYLSFFEKKGHLILESASLVPHNDDSLLIINSGMAPLKPYFTGLVTPPNTKIVTCQKCVRTGDIENVGKTQRHGTFFEMLGNFSFGDYFKEEAIEWAYEFCLTELEMPADKIFISIYTDDDEAFDIWHDQINIPKDKITRLGKEDNFWEVGLGPCGPCSELYYDRGVEYGCDSPTCAVGCECDRYIEFWNLVFTQFDKQEDGSYPLLENTAIDTGMGLERMAVIMQGATSIFDIDTMKAIRDKIVKIAKTTYGNSDKNDISIRVITDHARAATFMLADGIMPSNEGRGYVLRRLIRRAVRHGKLLNINQPFLVNIAQVVIEQFKGAYSNLEEKKDYIQKILAIEEENFHKTLDQGIQILNDLIATAKEKGHMIIQGSDAFKMYDTFGFPLPLMEEILEEHHIKIDLISFEEHMQAQRDRARAARADSNYMGAATTIYDTLPTDIACKFVGYSDLEETATITALISNNNHVTQVDIGSEVAIITDKTPMYALGGGQKGDIGLITTDNATVQILDTIKVVGERFAHLGNVTKGSIKINEQAKIIVDKNNRLNTARNHTATHLLHQALKNVLGTHVEQAGSEVTPNRLRFDFSHFEATTQEELTQIEDMVNEQILAAIDVNISEKTIADAKKSGAIALFGENYGDMVRVVTIGNFSAELCGGTHLTNTGTISLFKIISEGSVAAGIRRIEAITGLAAIEYTKKQSALIKELSQTLKDKPENLNKKTQTLLEQIKELKLNLMNLTINLSADNLGNIEDNIEEINGKRVYISRLDNLDQEKIRELGDRIKNKIKTGVIILLGANDNKVNILVMATDDMIANGTHAGKIAKELATITGGGGGGKPNMAQAGGKDITKIDQALLAIKDLV